MSHAPRAVLWNVSGPLLTVAAAITIEVLSQTWPQMPNVKDLTAEERARLRAAVQAVVLKTHDGVGPLLEELQVYLPRARGRSSPDGR